MRVLRVIGTRVALSLPLIFVVSALSFVLDSLVPGNILTVILGTSATPQSEAALRQQLGLDHSLPDEYWTWLVNALHGNLGTSYTSRQSVASEIASRLPVTLSLMILTLLVCATVGVLLGMLSAVRGRVIGRVIDTLAAAVSSMPNFWLATLLITAFAVQV